jgi:hypothetical protein
MPAPTTPPMPMDIAASRPICPRLPGEKTVLQEAASGDSGHLAEPPHVSGCGVK